MSPPTAFMNLRALVGATSTLNTVSNFQLKLSDSVNNLSVPINSTVHLRCQLPIIPKQKDSVYVIWRFRHSHKDPAPNIWSFIHKDDDLARCPEPPHTCEFVNQYVVLNRQNQSLFNNPSEEDAPFSSNDIELIYRRQLFTLKLTNLQPDMNGLFQCHVLLVKSVGISAMIMTGAVSQWLACVQLHWSIRTPGKLLLNFTKESSENIVRVDDQVFD
ncbi:unnamed protein product [Trichobilharzia regenti]|nr:unnamed protein product [Trichobilharzia regenti]